MTSDAIEDVKGVSGKSRKTHHQHAMLSTPDAGSAAATDPMKLMQDLMQSFGDLLSSIAPLLSAIAPLLQGQDGSGAMDGSPAGQSLGDALPGPDASSPLCGCAGGAPTGPSAGGPSGPSAAGPSGPSAAAYPPSAATPTAPTTPSASPDSSTGASTPAASANVPASATTPNQAGATSATPAASTAAPTDAFKWGSTVDPTPQQVAQKYHNEIARASNATGIDPKILAGMIWQESKGKPDTPGGGLMQIGDGEFQAHGGGNINNPADNIMAGAKYLKELSKPYGDNIKAGLRAYNSGPNGVDINNLNTTPTGTGKGEHIDKVLEAAEQSGL